MNPKYEKGENENEYEYGLRLISLKVENNPDDLDWQDIVDYLNLNCHRDSLRKAANVTPYSGYAVMQYFKKKYCDSGGNSYGNEIDDKIIELQKERQRFFDQRRELNKIRQWTARSEYLEDMLISAANNLPKFDLHDTGSVLYDYGSEAIVVFADWHYGMTANNIWNTYNKDICVERVQRFVKAASIRLHRHNVSKLHIVLLGDMAHGAIHTSVRVSSEELVCDQIMQVSELLATAIAELASCVKETIVYSTYGNHMRTIQNKTDSIHRDNMERLIPWWLKLRLKELDNIIFSPESEYEFVDICINGFNICAVHGDIDFIKQSPKSLNTLYTKKYGKSLDYILLADKHHLEEYEEFGIEAITIGSLCGTDEYANTKRLYSTPSQLLLTFDNNGKDATYSIRV